MPRPTQIQINPTALLHNVQQIKKQAPHSQLVGVVKCNAYGCGIKDIVPPLIGQVDKLAVTCIEEAIAIRQLGVRAPIVILQGVFAADEWPLMARYQFECVLHCPHQLAWLLETPLPQRIKIWIKINTGMNRLGFHPKTINNVLTQLLAHPWVDPALVLMSHFANAEQPAHYLHAEQQRLFATLKQQFANYPLSFNNSAAIFQSKETQGEFIRPGLCLYGISPFENQIGYDLGLKPVIQLISQVSHIFSIEKGQAVGYGSTWQAAQRSNIAIIPVGYGDGYPRHIQANTPVFINGISVPIVGRVSMDVLTVDVSNHPTVTVGSPVELWGEHLPIERIAHAAGTIPYELLVQMNRRT